jgi:hypothetical protein
LRHTLWGSGLGGVGWGEAMSGQADKYVRAFTLVFAGDKPEGVSTWKITK